MPERHRAPRLFEDREARATQSVTSMEKRRDTQRQCDTMCHLQSANKADMLNIDWVDRQAARLLTWMTVISAWIVSSPKARATEIR